MVTGNPPYRLAEIAGLREMTKPRPRDFSLAVIAEGQSRHSQDGSSNVGKHPLGPRAKGSARE